MNEAAVVEVGREALWVILKIAGPIMASGLAIGLLIALFQACLLYTSPSPRDQRGSRMPSSA